MAPSLNKCVCGASPRLFTAQVAEDAMETWVGCLACGRKTDEIEDAYSDPDGAAHLWNTGEINAP